jgi:hypothetical protein
MPERFAPLVVANPEPAPAPAASERAAAPAVALEPGDDSGDDDGASAPGAAPAGAQNPGGSAVYLSDKELLEAQSATDDGEVEE